MVHPLDPLSATTAVSPFVRETEQPVLPDPTQRIVATGDARNGGSATNNPANPNVSQQPDNLQDALDNINQGMQAWSTGMRFDIDQEAQRLVVSIVDSNSGEVLRTVPNEAVIRIAKMIVQLQGQYIDTQA